MAGAAPVDQPIGLSDERTAARRPAGSPPSAFSWAGRGGSKNGTPAVALLRDGFAVASISYRLSGIAKFPAQINDCKGAGHGQFRDPAVAEKVRAFFLKTLKVAAPAGGK